ncbi:hypothetical protein ACHAXS_007677 [Conticribra weissflogii]
MPIPPIPIFLSHSATSSAAKGLLLRNPASAAYAAAAARAGASSLLAAALGRDLWLRIPEWVREDDVWKSLSSYDDTAGDGESFGCNGENDEGMHRQQQCRDEMASLAAVIQKLQALIVMGYDKLGSERRALRRRRRVAQISKATSASALSSSRTTILPNSPLLQGNEVVIDQYFAESLNDHSETKTNNADPHTASRTCKGRAFSFMKISSQSFGNDGCNNCNCGNSLTCHICNDLNQADENNPSPSSASDDPTNLRISALEWHAALLAYFQLCNQIRERYPSWRDDMYKKCEEENQVCEDTEASNRFDCCDIGETDPNTFPHNLGGLKTSYDDDELTNRFIHGEMPPESSQPNYAKSEWALQHANQNEFETISNRQETSPKAPNKHSPLTSEQIDELRQMLDYAVWAYEPDEKRLRSLLTGNHDDLTTEITHPDDGTGFQLLVHRTTSYIEPTKDELADSASNTTIQHRKSFFSNRKSGSTKTLRKPPGRVGYYVAISHEKRTLLIGIKGTSTLEDLLTDCCGRAVRVDLDNDPHFPSKFVDALLSERCVGGPNDEIMCHGNKRCNLFETAQTVGGMSEETMTVERIEKRQHVENEFQGSADSASEDNNEESFFSAKMDAADAKHEDRVLGESHEGASSLDSEGKENYCNSKESQNNGEDIAVLAAVRVDLVTPEKKCDESLRTGNEPAKEDAIDTINDQNSSNSDVIDSPKGENLVHEPFECYDHFHDNGEASKFVKKAEWNFNDTSPDGKVEMGVIHKSYHGVLDNSINAVAFDENFELLAQSAINSQNKTLFRFGTTDERSEEELNSLTTIRNEGCDVVEIISDKTLLVQENSTTKRIDKQTHSCTTQTTEGNESSKENNFLREENSKVAIPQDKSIEKNREDINGSASSDDDINCADMKNNCAATSSSASWSKTANARSLTDYMRVTFSDEKDDDDGIEVQYVSLMDNDQCDDNNPSQQFAEESRSSSSNIFRMSSRPPRFSAAPQTISLPSDNILIIPSNSSAVSVKSQSKSDLRDVADEEIDGIEMEPQRSAKIRGAHEGVLHCAHQLLSEIIPLIEEYAVSKGYDVVCTGHSLGAGTASVLAILIRGRYPELVVPEVDSNPEGDALRAHSIHCFVDSTLSRQRVRAYSFASPPVLDRESSLACRHYVVTVVNNSDIIPRSSLTNLDVLLTVLEAVRSRLVELGMNPSSGSKSKGKGSFNNNVVSSIISLFKKLSEGSKGELLLTVEQLGRIRDEAIADASVGDGERDGLYWNDEGEHHLFVPGHVLMFYEPWSSSTKSSNNVKGSNGATENCSNQEEGNFDIDTTKVQQLSPNLSQSYRAMWTDGTVPVLKYFDIGGGSAIVTDHLTTSYYRALDSLKATTSCTIIH